MQTLYCYHPVIPGNLTNLLWSPNQQFAAFEESLASYGPVVRLLNLKSGNVQTIAQSIGVSRININTWAGNSQIYYTLYFSTLNKIHASAYVLDIPTKKITEVAPIAGNLWDMNLTPDNETLILSQCAYVFVTGGDGIGSYDSFPPSLISTQAAHGGALRFIYGNHVDTVVQTRIFDHGLLFSIEDNTFVVGPDDGLWKINFDGTGLTRLLKSHPLLADTHTTWASVSRDGKLYAIVDQPVQGSNTNQAYVGSINGGTPQRFAATSDMIVIVGWTTR